MSRDRAPGGSAPVGQEVAAALVAATIDHPLRVAVDGVCGAGIRS